MDERKSAEAKGRVAQNAPLSISQEGRREGAACLTSLGGKTSALGFIAWIGVR